MAINMRYRWVQASNMNIHTYTYFFVVWQFFVSSFSIYVLCLLSFGHLGADCVDNGVGLLLSLYFVYFTLSANLHKFIEFWIYTKNNIYDMKTYKVRRRGVRQSNGTITWWHKRDALVCYVTFEYWYTRRVCGITRLCLKYRFCIYIKALSFAFNTHCIIRS